MIKQANFTELQLLYSKELSNHEEFAWLFENRDRRVRSNMGMCYTSIRGFVSNCLKHGTRKDMVKALCYTTLIGRALDFGAFDTEVKGLSEYRTNLDLEISKEDVEKELNRYKHFALHSNKDEEIISELDKFIIRLVKKGLEIV